MRSGIDNSLTTKIINLLGELGFDFKKIRITDTLRLRYRNDSLVEIEYQLSPTKIYYFNLENLSNIKVALCYRPVSTVLTLVKGHINSSLYESMLAIGERPSLIINYAEILDWEIDFFTETQSGDSFFVLVEKKFCDSILIDYGKIYALRYKGKIGDLYGFYFCDPNGHKDFYNYEGQSLRKEFLKSPLRYSYISSYFSRARLHPILKIVRPHRGIDYVAPAGTPISAIGDGVVSYAGWKGSYGHFVEIRHARGFTSRYGHLRNYGKGIKTGQRVRQGQIIGYVGSTGLATGPHLHFELLRNSSWVNPLKVIVPRAEPVKPAFFNDFIAVRDSFKKLLQEQDRILKKPNNYCYLFN
jgi:murein DD-endopeptidase MepM/ murein hydrolase activator NlpD